MLFIVNINKDKRKSAAEYEASTVSVLPEKFAAVAVPYLFFSQLFPDCPGSADNISSGTLSTVFNKLL